MTTLSKNQTSIMILAAGMGKRMRSALPKVLHSICGQPLLFHILDRVLETSPKAPIAIVVGFGREQVESAVRGNPRFAQLDLTFVIQSEQKGTGHAARCAMDSSWGERVLEAKSPVLILAGDTPLLPRALIEQMLAPLGRGEAIRMVTCEVQDPKGYGRIVRRGKSVIRIVEEKDATPREKAIREINPAIYQFQAQFLRYGLTRLSNKNAQGEYYLTDLIAQASSGKKKIDVVSWASSEELSGINDPWQLAQAERILNERTLRRWAGEGVHFIDPWSTHVDVHVELAEGVQVHPGAILRGGTRVARGAMIGPHVLLNNAEVGEGAQIKIGTVIEDSFVGAKVQMGPYAHLRPESRVEKGAKIGNFVELKKSRIGEGTSVAHLSYLGDAEVGARVNIGCGFVTCNFDGRVIDGSRKHKTVIEDDVFLGSDCQTIAPVRIGKGAYIASGSTITENVESDALAIARTRQVTKPGYAKKLRSRE